MAKKGKHLGGLSQLMEGLVNLNRQFIEIGRAASYEIAQRAVEIAQENIDNGGSEDGPFQDHHELTSFLTEKIRSGSTAGILNESGNLRDSIKVTKNTVAGGRIHVDIGSDSVYAAIHEFGGTPGGAVSPGAIPPRPYLRPAVRQAIWESLGGDLEDRIAQACDLCVQKKPWRHLFR